MRASLTPRAARSSAEDALERVTKRTTKSFEATAVRSRDAPAASHLLLRMDGSDADVLLRMRDQADNFEKKVGKDKDDKVNDGNNYSGMLSAADYKKRRAEVLEDHDLESIKREKAHEIIKEKILADRAEAAKDVQEREERERLRKERIQAELAKASSSGDAEGDEEPSGSSGGPKKKKKKKAVVGEGAGLSFDADE